MVVNSYLKKLKYDLRLDEKIYAKYLKNFRITLLLILSILIFGFVNFFNIPRRLNPEVDLPIVTVVTVYPGASASEVETLITDPLEKVIKGIADIDSLVSSSSEGRSIITVQFSSKIDAKFAEDEVSSVVSKVTDLPDDAQDPVVQAVDFENEPIWIFSLYSADSASLQNLAENLKTRLENQDYIDSVVLSGLADNIVNIKINPEKLEKNQISFALLQSILKEQFNSYPVGKLKDSKYEYSFTISKTVSDLNSLRNLAIRTGSGSIITLSELAEIYIQDSDFKQSYFADRETEPVSAVQFQIFRNKNYDIDYVDKQTKQQVSEFLKPYQNKYKISSIENSAELIEEQFSELFRESLSTIALVFFVLLVFLGIKQALIAVLTIPLTFLSAIGLINTFGLSLNFLTLFAFLLTLGLLIDDTIVVVTAMTRYFATGKFSPYQTGVLVWKDFFVPLWSTTATTIWSFVPLLLATGIIGEFIKPIPIVVTLTMLSSTSIAVLITLPLMIVVFNYKNIPYRVWVFLKIILALIVLLFAILIFRQNVLFGFAFILFLFQVALLFYYRSYFSKLKNFGFINSMLRFSRTLIDKFSVGIVNIEIVSVKYRNLLSTVLNNESYAKQILIFLFVFTFISFLLLPFKLLRTEFFPKTDSNIVYVSLNFPTGYKTNQMIPLSLKTADELRKIPEVLSLSVDLQTGLNERLNRTVKTNSVLITVNIGSDKKRKRQSFQIADEIRQKLGKYSKDVDFVVQEISGGPPAGADIQVSFLGDDYSVLNQLSEKAISFLKKDPDVSLVESSYKVGNGQVVFIPDNNILSKYGISKRDVYAQLSLYLQGLKLTDSVLQDQTEYEFRLYFQDSFDLTSLVNLQINTSAGVFPITALGSLTYKENPIDLQHEDAKRKVTVFAYVKKGVSAVEKNAELLQFLNSQKLPEGYSIKTGGVNQENQRSVQSILQAMLAAFILILITMVLVFNSFRQAFLVIVNIPLSISGVFYLFALTGTPLSFPSLIGILALFGIVVTNAIVVVDKINLNLREGFGFKEAIINGSTSRLEPVLLTSLTTIFGLLPITISDPLWRGLGGAIISGLLFSGIIKLFFVPLAYFYLYKNSKQTKK
ncbi:MAG: hypothetical protein KatS3mg090_0517 [Patescibacteria group bacterium]|nr:MAG: hypothetical protein KatS3mg090_0517 [Patescibacteria group bacterium]